MLTTFALLSLLSATGPRPGPVPTGLVVGGQPAADGHRPRVEVWTDRGDDPYHSGQSARVHFRADRDAYVTILRVDTDGRVRALFPREPWEDNFARGGREYEVLGGAGSDRDAFYIDDYPGVGYVFGIAAADPFVYDRLESNDHWDYRTIADGRVRGDPYVALTDLAQRIVPGGYEDWDYDIVPYYVEQHYDYPRFLCYDCHSYVSYPYWSPYDYTCVRFRIVVYDDPYYYPYRYYGGTRVVFTRPARPEPRFIFRDRRGSDAFITRVRERPVNYGRRRDVGVRGRDLGGIGVIPPPRQHPVTGNQGGDDDRDRRGGRGSQHPDRPGQPDRPDRPARRDRPDRPDNVQNQHRPERRDRPERPDRPDRPDRQDRPAQPPPPPPPPPPPSERPARPAEPERRAEPRREAPPQRVEPRAEPNREAPREKPRAEPELKRRKP